MIIIICRSYYAYYYYCAYYYVYYAYYYYYAYYAYYADFIAVCLWCSYDCLHSPMVFLWFSFVFHHFLMFFLMFFWFSDDFLTLGAADYVLLAFGGHCLLLQWACVHWLSAVEVAGWSGAAAGLAMNQRGLDTCSAMALALWTPLLAASLRSIRRPHSCFQECWAAEVREL